MEMLLQWYRATKQHPFSTMAAALAVVALTMGVIAFYPRTYQSRAQLLLRVGYENATVDPTAEASGQIVQMQLTRKNDIQTALEVMNSRALLAEVVEQLGPDTILDGVPVADVNDEDASPSYIDRVKDRIGSTLASLDPITDRERAIRELSSRLDVFAAAEASVVNAHYRDKSPHVAQAVLNTWLDAYLSKHAELHRTTGSYDFFRTEESELRNKLDSVYEQLRDAKTSSGLVTIAGQQKLLEDQLAAVRTALVEVDTTLAGSQARTDALRQTLEETEDRTVIDETSGKTNEARDSMRGKLFELEVLEREYASKYKPDHPRLVAIRSQLAEAQQIVEEQNEDRAEITSGINPVYQKLQQEWLLEHAAQTQHRQRRQSLVEQRDALTREIAALNDSERQILALERQATILEDQYAKLSERLDQSRIDESLRKQKITSVNVIQPASLEERPVTPDKRLTAAFGLLGLIASVIGLPLVLASYDSLTPIQNRNEFVLQNAGETSTGGNPSDQESLLHPMFFDGREEADDGPESESVAASPRKAH